MLKGIKRKYFEIQRDILISFNVLKLDYVLSNSFDKSKDSIIVCWQRGKVTDETNSYQIPE
jgi:hypothetical protein